MTELSTASIDDFVILNNTPTVLSTRSGARDLTFGRRRQKLILVNVVNGVRISMKFPTSKLVIMRIPVSDAFHSHEFNSIRTVIEGESGVLYSCE